MSDEADLGVFGIVVDYVIDGASRTIEVEYGGVRTPHPLYPGTRWYNKTPQEAIGADIYMYPKDGETYYIAGNLPDQSVPLNPDGSIKVR